MSQVRKLRIALDVGTFGTGIAWRSLDEDEIQTVNNWPGSHDQPNYPKTRTAMLYKKGVPIHFGWEARNTFGGKDDLQIRNGGYVYIDRFKLNLTNDPRCRQLPPGFTAQKVMTDFLRMFKDHCLEYLQDVFVDGEVYASNVQWCLTVPAIWKDYQKDMMREAAFNAGLISEKHSDQLLIILEPEAAVLHAGVDGLNSLVPNTTVMMVDAGGGTVDLTVHSIQRRHGQLALTEAAAGIGGLCGSTFVDDNFEAWFRKEVGPSAFDEWKRRCVTEYLKMMSKWEDEKRNFRPGAKAAWLTLPPQLLGLMSASAVKTLQDRYDEVNKVCIQPVRMQGFFEPQIAEVVDLVKQLRRRCMAVHIDKMLLVGGFSASAYFVACMKERLATVCHPENIVVPAEPQSVILKGAAQYLPSAFTARRMRLAYAVKAYRTATPSDPEHLCWHHSEDDEMKIHSLFYLVKAGSLVGSDEVTEHSFFPVYKTSTAITFLVYATNDNSIPYWDESRGLTKVAELVVEVEPGREKRDEVVVKLLLGREELTVSAVNKRTGKALQVTAEFCPNTFHDGVPAPTSSISRRSQLQQELGLTNWEPDVSSADSDTDSYS